MKIKNLIALAIILTSSFAYSQLTGTEPEPEKSELLTHYDKPASIKTKDGKIYNGTIRYKEYGKMIIYFKDENSNSEDFTIITQQEGLDSIEQIHITNESSPYGDGKFVFAPIQLNPESGMNKLVQVVESNDAYTAYKFFQSTKKSFTLNDDPAPKNSLIPGHYDEYVYSNVTKEFYRKLHVKSLNKNIEEYIDYCPEVTDKVKKKAKGYKPSLLVRNYDILKKVLLESYEKCKQ